MFTDVLKIPARGGLRTHNGHLLVEAVVDVPQFRRDLVLTLYPFLQHDVWTTNICPLRRNIFVHGDGSLIFCPSRRKICLSIATEDVLTHCDVCHMPTDLYDQSMFL